jgi:hypothetical protein
MGAPFIFIISNSRKFKGYGFLLAVPGSIHNHNTLSPYLLRKLSTGLEYHPGKDLAKVGNHGYDGSAGNTA